MGDAAPSDDDCLFLAPLQARVGAAFALDPLQSAVFCFGGVSVSSNASTIWLSALEAYDLST
jgi:hypothetical protein